MTRVDALFAPSEYTAKRHRNAGLKPPIHVLPLFSAIEPRSDPPPRPLDLVSCLSVVSPTSKGIVQLLEEFAELAAYDLHVIGDGDLRGKLEQRFIGCRHIRFLGRIAQAELVAAYQRCNGTDLSITSTGDLRLEHRGGICLWHACHRA